MEIFYITTHLGNYNREAKVGIWNFIISLNLVLIYCINFSLLMILGNKFTLDFIPRDKWLESRRVTSLRM